MEFGLGRVPYSTARGKRCKQATGIIGSNSFPGTLVVMSVLSFPDNPLEELLFHVLKPLPLSTPSQLSYQVIKPQIP